MAFEKFIDWLRRLFWRRKVIRLGFYGETNAGKCLAEGERVLLSNGSYARTEELFEQAFRAKGGDANAVELYIPCQDLNIAVPSFNKQTLKVEHKAVSHVFRQRYKGEMVRVRTRNGKTVSASPDHPFICITPEGVTQIRAGDLHLGARVAVLSQFQPLHDFEPISIPQELRLREDGLMQVEMKFHRPKPFQPQYALNSSLARFFAYTIAESSHGKNDINFFNDSPELRDDFQKIAQKEFGLEAKYKRIGEKTPQMDVYNKSLVEFLSRCFDLVPATSAHKKVPRSILLAEQEVVREFLRTMYDCEGSVCGSKESMRSIELTSASRELAGGIQILLLRFGIPSSVREKNVKGKSYWSVEIRRSDNHRKFMSEIGFSLGYKQRRLEEICRYSSKANVHVVPIIPILERVRKELGLQIKQFYGRGYHYYRDVHANRITVDRLRGIVGKWGELSKLQEAKRIIEADVFWDDVVEVIREPYDGFIYDLTVDDNHTFLTWDGLVVHNTSLANRISMDWLGEPVGKVSEIPHETREVQKKEHVIVRSKGKELEMNLLDMPGIATKVDYRDFIAYGLKKSDAQKRAKEATKGIIEAIKWLENVDAALVVMDSCGDPFTQVNITILGNLEARKIPVILVANKIDSKNAKPEKVQEAFPQHTVVAVSALTGENMNKLYEAIAKHAR